MEETLVLIKPDGVKRQICGEILTRYERKGLIIKAMKLLQTPKELAQEHYAEHKDNHSLVNWLILSLLDLY